MTGLIATTCTSVAGLLFTSRARRAPSRDLLYSKQLEYHTRLLTVAAGFHAACASLAEAAESEQKAAWAGFLEANSRLNSLGVEGFALAPAALVEGLRRTSAASVDLVHAYLDGGNRLEALSRVEAAIESLVATGRRALGVDSLSGELMSLFGAKDLSKQRLHPGS